MNITLNEILTNLSNCYKTIDIRTLAVFNEVWKNVVTRISFSIDEEKEDVKFDKRGELILVKAKLPFQKWSEIKEQFKGAQLKFIPPINKELDPSGTYPKVEIQLRRVIDLEDVVCYLSPQLEWPGFRLLITEVLQSQLIDKSERACVKYGYSNLKDFVKYELGLELNFHPQSQFIEAVAPVHAKIGDVRLTKDHLAVKIFNHCGLQPLYLTIEYNEKYFKRMEVPQIKDTINEIDMRLPYPDLDKVSDYNLNLELIHDELGLIHSHSVNICELVNKSGIVATPLFSALSNFLPNNALLEDLINPGKVIKSGRPQDVFESAICNFLSAAGFSTIALGKNENIKLGSGNIIGSADALAYDRVTGTLLVISCKTAIPNKSVIDQINSTSEQIKLRLPNLIYKFICVVPIIFTNQIAHAQKDEAKKFGVIVVDKPSLENLYKLAQVRSLDYSDLRG